MIKPLILSVAFSVCAGVALARQPAPITADDLANIQDIGGHDSGAMSISPDGEYVAFQLQTPVIADRNYNLTWYVARARAGGEITPVGDGGAIILNPEKWWSTNGNRPATAPLWSPDGKSIVYLKNVEGRTQLWRSSIDGSSQDQLTHSEADVLSTTFDLQPSLAFKFIDNGKALLFATARNPKAIEEEIQTESDGGLLYDTRFLPGMTKHPFIRACDSGNVDLRRSCNPQWRVYVFGTGLERNATDAEIAANVSLGTLSPDNIRNRIIFSYREANDRNRQAWLENENPKQYPGVMPPLQLFGAESGTVHRCPADECRAYKGVIENIWFRPGNSEIIFQRADGVNKSMTGLYAWTPGAESVRTILKTEDLLDDCEILESRAICLREQWAHPRTIVSIELDDGSLETIYDPNPGYNEIAFSRIDKVEWKDEFGEGTHGHLVYPLNYEEGKRYPLVITTYRSRGFLRGGVGDEYPIHLFAASGFMVLSHDKPRSFDRFARMANPREAEWGEFHERRSTLSAQLRALKILDERGLIDLQRVAITGLSDGADQVNFALSETDHFTTGIVSGANDYRALYYLSNKAWRSHWTQRFAGSPDEDAKGYWRTLSIGQNTDRIEEPYLVNVSDNEFLFSVEAVSRLEDNDRAVEMYVFPGEYHVKWQPQHRLAIYRRNVQWLKFWLMGKEEDDPVSPGQYDRWRKMRDDHCATYEADTVKPSYCAY